MYIGLTVGTSIESVHQSLSAGSKTVPAEIATWTTDHTHKLDLHVSLILLDLNRCSRHLVAESE